MLPSARLPSPPASNSCMVGPLQHSHPQPAGAPHIVEAELRQPLDGQLRRQPLQLLLRGVKGGDCHARILGL
jgi:hypothetical protein